MASEVLRGTNAANHGCTQEMLLANLRTIQKELERLEGLIGSGGGSPLDATYITASSNVDLTEERVAQDSTSILVDVSVASAIAFKRAAITGAITIDEDSNEAIQANNSIGAIHIQDLSITGAKIAAGTIPDSKLSNMSANTVKVNATAGSAVPTNLFIGQNQFLGRGASGNLAALSLGTGLSFTGTTLNAAAAVDLATILALDDFLRAEDNGNGGFNIIRQDGSVLTSVAGVYAFPGVTIGGVTDLPALTEFAHGTVLRFHPDNLVGFGINPLGFFMMVDRTNSCLVPFGKQMLFSSHYGNLAADYLTVTNNNNAQHFSLGTGGDPILPANLLVPKRTQLGVQTSVRKIGANQPTMLVNFGTDLVTYTNNNPIYSQAFATTANCDLTARSVVRSKTATAALATCRAQFNGAGIGNARLDLASVYNTAARMMISFGTNLATVTDETRMYDFEIWIE